MSERKTRGAALLREYIQKLGLNPSKAEKAIHATTGKKLSRVSIWQYVTEKVSPSRKNAATIAEWSNNEVPMTAWDTIAVEASTAPEA